MHLRAIATHSRRMEDRKSASHRRILTKQRSKTTPQQTIMNEEGSPSRLRHCQRRLEYHSPRQPPHSLRYCDGFSPLQCLLFIRLML